jgi:DNA invertase Pin-like site-specific DNA recombinase
MSLKNLNPLTPKNRSTVIKKFIEGKVPLDQVIEELGKSRATIYRYAKLIAKGKELIDQRSLTCLRMKHGRHLGFSLCSKYANYTEYLTRV